MEPLELLRTNVAAFNEWRTAHPTERLDFSRQNFSGLQLSRAYLVNIDLTGCSFAQAVLEEAVFCNSCGDDADFTGIAGIKTCFGEEKPTWPGVPPALRIHLEHPASLRGADFRKARLGHANFWRTSIAYADFTEADLSYCNFIETDNKRAIFLRANMTHTLMTERLDE